MLYFDEDLKDFVFLGDNIPNQVENIIKQLDETSTYKMPKEVKEGYDLGIKTTISILRQYLDKGIEEYGVIFYRPDIEYGEEMDLEEVKEWVYSREE